MQIFIVLAALSELLNSDNMSKLPVYVSGAGEAELSLKGMCDIMCTLSS